MRRTAIAVLIVALAAPVVLAQGRGRGRTAPPTVEPAEITCPLVLGDGVATGRMFCDVAIGRDPAQGIIVTIPPHTGDVTLRFDLHNRHTYSEQQIASGRGYHRYTAVIGVLTMDGELISRAAVMNEFRTAEDLVDRVTGGSGPGGLKAVAPTGTQPVVITIPAGEERVSILGETLKVERVDGTDEFAISGRPIALISNVTLEYRPRAGRR